MIPIDNKHNIDDKIIQGHSWIEDIVYFNEPLMSLYKNEADQKFLYIWCDRNDNSDRWVIFEIGQENLDSFLNQKITLLELFNLPNQKIVFDINADDQKTNFKFLNNDDYPKEYLPSKKSYLYSEIMVKTIDSRGQ